MKAFSPLAMVVAFLPFMPVMAAQTRAPTEQKHSPTMLGIVAHADDALIFAPLLARYSRQGAKVYLVAVASEETPTSGRPATPGRPHGKELTRIVSDER
jgi:LmbE family N-acetylglucosaminyl deacetylase